MSRQSTSRERTHATGKITVTTYEATPYDQPEEGPALVTIHVVEGFSGDIEGEGAATFLQTTTADGKASFVGVERVTGTIGGRSGTFVLQDQGTLENSVVSGEWFVVPGSGTGELSRLRGEGGFRAAEGQAQTSPSTTGSNEPTARRQGRDRHRRCHRDRDRDRGWVTGRNVRVNGTAV